MSINFADYTSAQIKGMNLQSILDTFEPVYGPVSCHQRAGPGAPWKMYDFIVSWLHYAQQHGLDVPIIDDLIMIGVPQHMIAEHYPLNREVEKTILNSEWYLQDPSGANEHLLANPILSEETRSLIDFPKMPIGTWDD